MRRSTLHCALLSAVFISAIFTLSRFLNHDSARAAILKTPTQTQGSLQVIDEKGKAVGDCPLKHTAVKAQVSGFISRVTVTQEFENPLPEKIEAIYTFSFTACSRRRRSDDANRRAHDQRKNNATGRGGNCIHRLPKSWDKSRPY